jgi:hypothetical protein
MRVGISLLFYRDFQSIYSNTVSSAFIVKISSFLGVLARNLPKTGLMSLEWSANNHPIPSQLSHLMHNTSRITFYE